MDQIPSFDDLPLNKNDPPLSAWGLYGPHDQLGFLNRLTGEVVVEAAKEIRTGQRVSLNWPLDAQTKPGFGRLPFEHRLVHKAPRAVYDDIWVLNSQSSSQWDGLRHFAYQGAQRFYNGVTLENIKSPGNPFEPRLAGVNGVHFWSERGIVGRGVLLDFSRWREHVLRHRGVHDINLVRRLDAFDPFASCAIELDDLKAIAIHQHTEFRPADILIVRTGYIAAYGRKSQQELDALHAAVPPTAAGLQRSEGMLRFIWDNFAAVAGDAPACEVWPGKKGELLLHEVLLAGWGCPIGELWDLEALSEECLKQNRYTFFLTSEPCNVRGAVASPPNALAIF